MDLIKKTSKFIETKSTMEMDMWVKGKTFAFCLLREAWDGLEEIFVFFIMIRWKQLLSSSVFY